MFLKIKKGLLAFVAVAFTAAVCLLAVAGLTLGTPYARRVSAEGEIPDGAYAKLEFDGATNYYLTSDGSSLSTVFTDANAKQTTEESPAKITVLADRKEAITATLTVEASKFIMLDLNGCMLDFSGFAETPITVSDGTLTLTDSNPTTEHKYYVNEANGLYVFSDSGLNICKGGVITGGSTLNDGGAVSVTSTFIMEGGTIAGNQAARGGGVGVNNGTFEMKGGAIKGNVSSNKGGGVYLTKASQSVLKISGMCHITDNYNYKSGKKTATNVDINSVTNGGVSIIIGGELSKDGMDSVIGLTPVTLDKTNYVNFYGDGNATYNEDREISDFFVLDDEATSGATKNYAVTTNLSGSALVQRYATLDDAWTAASNATSSATVEMYAGADTTSTLEVASGKIINLDLNGHTLEYKGTAISPVIKVVGSFRLADGGKTENAEGTLTGGKLGGVNVAGGTFTMNGGTITGNDAALGGGVNVAAGTFTMNGGTITNNTVTNNGGGVYVANGGTFNVSGTLNISDNTKVDGAQNNVYLDGTSKINVSGALSEGAIISISNTGNIATGYIQADKAALHFVPDSNSSACVSAKSGAVTIDTHTGGTATCTNKAVCENCGEEYGETDPDNHTPDLSKWEDTVDNHYRVCKDCKVKIESTKAAHDTSGTDGACSVCGYKPQSTHSPQDPVRENEKKATCIRAGSYEEVVYCSICENEISRITKTIPATGKHELTSLKITKINSNNYDAFDKIKTENIVVKTHCATCDQDIATIAATDYKVVYKNGNCFHAGDTSVTVEYITAADKKLTAPVSVARVGKLSVAVTWQYSEKAVNPVWGDWKSEFNYRSNLQDLKPNVRAVFTDGNGVEREYRGSDTLVITLKDGERQSAIRDAGDYTLSLNVNASEFADYSFTDNNKTIKIKPASVELNNEDNFYWQMEENDAALLSGYIDESVFKYFSTPDTGRTRVERSVVRDRNKKVVINLFGAHSTDIMGEDGVYDIEYDGEYFAQGLGKYTAKAILTLNNPNYVFKITGSFPADRHMKVEINDDGTVSITKIWYIAQVDNGLLSQQSGEAYGKDWTLKGWTYGAQIERYAPRLEHGDPGEYLSTKTFAANDDLVTFELYSIVSDEEVDRVLIGEKFNRYAFADYINSSMPAGSYVLVVYVNKYTSIEHVHWYDGTQHDGQMAGIFYDAFESEFNFTVAKAAFTQTNIDTLANTTYNFTYDGNIHLFDDTFKLNAPVKGDRVGEWAKADYDSYFGNAELTYNLTRWDTGAYLTADGVASFNNEWQKPQGVDSYTVRYKLTAPNYRDLGGDKYFTVVINKADYNMSKVTYDDLEATYDGTVRNITVKGLPEGVSYHADGRINAGTHKLIVTFTGDTVNYNPIPSDSVTLIIYKAHVAVPETHTATFDGNSYTYIPDSPLYEVVGDATFTKAGKYDITLSLKDADNYTWHTEDGVISNTTFKVQLDLKAEQKPVGPAQSNGGNTVDVWLILDIIMGVVIAGEVVYIVCRLLRKNKDTEGAE